MYSGMLALFVAAYATVLVAELVGDKTLYTLGSLATRFRLGPILIGAAMAFMIKMLIAVLLGRQLAELPEIAVSAVSAATFFAMALVFALKQPAAAPKPSGPQPRWHHATLIAFAAIFFPEWGDAGQLTAAVLVAQHQAPAVIWTAATLAMVTKAALAVTLGVGLRRFVPQHVVRVVTVMLCVVMGCLAALRIEL